ncbi:MAG: hypothetical protein KDI61_03585 [Alphaproteobacteria bacterium]|nr:hypothetical protein [Alphaproteobacteria bacterium]
MTTDAEHFKHLRNILLDQSESLGISTPAAQIGQRDSESAIDAGMSDALEQLVLLAQLHAGRSDDTITRGYSEANIALVRQYMKDRGVGIDTIDQLTGTIQALDTPAGGQTRSVFDQQYMMGGTDLTMFKIQNEALLSGTQRGEAVAAARPLSVVFSEARDDSRRTEAEAPHDAEVPMTRYSTSYSYDQIQALKGQGLKSVEEQAVLDAWDENWRRYTDSHGFTEIDERYNRAHDAWVNRGHERSQLYQQASDKRVEAAALLDRLQDQKLTVHVDGQTFHMSWNEIYAEVGYWEINDSTRQAALRREGLRALEELKDQPQGYNAMMQEASQLSQRAFRVMGERQVEYSAALRERNAAFTQLRDDPVRLTVMIPNYDATPETQVAAETHHGAGGAW